MIKNKIIYIFIISLWACSQSDDATLNTQKPVVEAYLHPKYAPMVKIKIESAFGENSAETFNDLNGLTVNINYNGTTITLSNTSNGTYTVYDNTIIMPNTTYTLSFKYNETLVSTYTSVPEKPKNFAQSVTEISMPTINFGSGTPPSGGGSLPTFPEPVKLTWNNSEGKYYLVVVQNIESNPSKINENTDRPSPTFRNEPTTLSQHQINAQTFSYYGKHIIILFVLNPEYAALYQSSSNSSLNLNNPQTNIENGLGIFTGFNSDTLMLNVTKQ
ncbi:MAG: DUF4249 family protein [Cytophagales bacterium]|nr:DUF4249 family protein [Cytophagales bacterium]